AARGVPQRWQLRSRGGLATPQLGFAHRLGGPSGSVGAPSAWIRKPQSMQAMAPSSSFEPQAGQTLGVLAGWTALAAPERAPLPALLKPGDETEKAPLGSCGLGTLPDGGLAGATGAAGAAGDTAAARGGAAGGALPNAGIMNGFLHDGQDTRLPPA